MEQFEAADAGGTFAFKIDFEKHAPNPGRVFRAAYDLIDAFQQMDADLVGVIDTSIQPVLFLEEVETGSLRVWLKTVLEHLEDDALKTLDWKPLVGRYLVKAKYIAIDLLNKQATATDRSPFDEASRQIANAAAETDVKHLPDYKPPSIATLAKHLRLLSDAKAVLGPNDKLLLQAAGEADATFDMRVSVSDEQLDRLLTKETIVRPPYEMILRIKRPDYLGTAKWDFRHGRTPLAAKITDEAWLDKFHGRRIVVRPGDALRCEVVEETHYDYDNDVLAQHFTVIRVLEVIEGEAPQGEFDFP